MIEVDDSLYVIFERCVRVRFASNEEDSKIK